MADWESLRAYLTTGYQVAVDERAEFHNPEWDGLSVWVDSSAGRRLVAVQRRKDYSDDWYLEASAPITTTGTVDPQNLLEWTGRSVGALTLAQGQLFYRRVYPMEWLDVPRVDAALRDVAGTGVGLEKSLAEFGSI